MRQTVSAEPWLPGGGPAHSHLKARDGVHSSARAAQACTPDSTEMSVTLDTARGTPCLRHEVPGTRWTYPTWRGEHVLDSQEHGALTRWGCRACGTAHNHGKHPQEDSAPRDDLPSWELRNLASWPLGTGAHTPRGCPKSPGERAAGTKATTRLSEDRASAGFLQLASSPAQEVEHCPNQQR